MNASTLWCLGFAVLGISFGGGPIIVRHDRGEEQSISLARQYQGLVHMNLPTPTGAKDGEGTLIAPTWVLTAGHVGVDVPSDHSVTVGEETIAIDTVIVHPDWEGGAHDLALVKLSNEVLHTAPVGVYRERRELGQVVVLLGYGDYGTGLTGPVGNDGRVRGATNRVDDVTDAWLVFRFDEPSADNVTELEGVSGPGDSGGPALLEIDGQVLLAGVSSGQSTRDADGPGRYGVVEYYVRVSSYLVWIDDIVEH